MGVSGVSALMVLPFGSRGGCTFELLARFNVVDQGYAHLQVLGVPEGVDVGQITVVEVDGTLAVVGNECAFTTQVTPVQGDQGLRGRQAGGVVFTRSLGKAVLVTNLELTGNNLRLYIGWGDTTGVVMWADAIPGLISFQTGARLNVWEGVTAAEVGAYAAATEYDIAVVLGGYDVNGVPWDDTQVAANFLYGAASFIRGGAFTDWTLLWRTVSSNAASLEAILSNMNHTGTLDDFRVPIVDYSQVLQPTVKDTFTDANGTSLDAHTPDVPLGGAGWVEDAGNWDIQTNRADPSQVSGSMDLATTDGLSEGFLRGAVHLGQAALDVRAGLTYRYIDVNNYWCSFIYGTGNFTITELNGGVQTVRASAPGVGAPNTTFELTDIFDGDAHQAWADGGNRLTFVSALHQNATRVGLRAFVNGAPTNGNWFDNFHLQPRDDYSALDECP